jgi:glycosyltransferase involved in cell wall biosynthesis
MKKNKLSVVLATRNEEKNIAECLETVKSIADEIIVVDEGSTDKTREIAKKYRARVYKVKHKEIFHKTKQKALDYATGDWILQLDADERVSETLGHEIKKVINLSNEKIRKRRPKDKKKWRLFQKHQKLIEEKDYTKRTGPSEISAFYVPRVNYFLGKPLRYAGVYPDGVIRLIKKGKARFPAKSVHELMRVDGEAAWLFNDLEHYDSPTFERYIARLNRYTDIKSDEFLKAKIPLNLLRLLYYSLVKPLFVFTNLYIRHKGFLEGVRGFIWSLFSAFHYPISYFKYWQKVKN